MYYILERKLSSGETIILDGGTGTEIERRGVPMSGEVWGADANLSHPGAVRSVHAEYIGAGAEVIVANTFATSPLLFDHYNRIDDIAKIDRVAIDLARAAAAGKPVAGGKNRNAAFTVPWRSLRSSPDAGAG